MIIGLMAQDKMEKEREMKEETSISLAVYQLFWVGVEIESTGGDELKGWKSSSKNG